MCSSDYFGKETFWLGAQTIILLSTMIAAVSIGNRQNEISKQLIESERPFVTTKNTGLAISSIENNKITIQIPLFNYGSTIANNVEIFLRSFLNNELRGTREVDPNSVFLPPQSDLFQQTIYIEGKDLNDYFNPRNEWTLNLIIKYKGIASQDYSTEILLKYNHKTKWFDVISARELKL